MTKKYTVVGKDVSVYAMSPEKAVVRILKGEKAPLKETISIMDSKEIYTYYVIKMRSTKVEKEKHGNKFEYKLKIQLKKKAHKEFISI